ncbi:oligosaccharide flippase family protein [Vibrio parahaemolyticus]|nr:oligosaccharide flippase family protein [Vibrio parahaemolyticus]
MLAAKNKTVKNILFVISGTAGAQAIGLVFSPLITRLYGPEAFGNFGVFLTLVSIFVPMATLSFNYAISLPKDNNKSLHLAIYTILLSGIISSMLLLSIFLLGHELSDLIGIDKDILFILPMTVFFSSLVSIFQQVKMRREEFSLIAKTNFTYSLFNNLIKLGLGLIIPTPLMLVLSMNVSLLIHATLIKCKLPRYNKEVFRGNLHLISRYSDFAIYRTPQILINIFSQSMPVLFLSSYFGAVSVGYFTLSKMVLSIPISLVGKSVHDVMFPKMAEVRNSGRKIGNLVLKTTIILCVIGFLPFLAISLFSNYVFGFVFGAEWYDAGYYASWMSVWLYFALVNRVCVAAIPILKLQKHFLIYEVFSLLMKLFSIFLTSYYSNNEIYAIAAFCITSAISNLMLMIFVIIKSKVT